MHQHNTTRNGQPQAMTCCALPGGSEEWFTQLFQVFAGYTYMQARQIDGGPLGKANDGNQLPNTPNNSANISSKQDLKLL